MRYLIAAFLLVVPTSAFANVLNGDIENNVSGQFGAIQHWGPNGGWALHSGFAKPNNGTLGASFGFMSAGTTERVGQQSSLTFLPAVQYTFSSWAFPGGDPGLVGEIVYQIGYDDGGGNFVPLATQAYDITGQDQWLPLVGVSYTPAAGPELGKQVWVRLGDGADGAPGNDDVWFDNLTLTPEPGSLILFVLAGIGLIRRR